MYRPYTIDFETTGKDATKARPIEVGYQSVCDAAIGGRWFIALPPGETVPPETSAVHHIIDEDLEGARDWETSVRFLGEYALGGTKDLILVAHNADYEKAIMAGTWADEVPWVCTYKVALILFPEAPSHSNEALRYWLKLGENRGRRAGQASHSAQHDAIVTADLFRHFCGVMINRNGWTTQQAIEEMVYLTTLPAELPTCPIGKERGKKWQDIDAGYLQWCLKQADMREDVKYACRKELQRRGAYLR